MRRTLYSNLITEKQTHKIISYYKQGMIANFKELPTFQKNTSIGKKLCGILHFPTMLEINNIL